MSRRRRGPTKKARKRERREARRHGFDDLGDYLQWRADQYDGPPGSRRRRAWRARQEGRT